MIFIRYLANVPQFRLVQSVFLYQRYHPNSHQSSYQYSGLVTIPEPQLAAIHSAVVQTGRLNIGMLSTMQNMGRDPHKLFGLWLNYCSALLNTSYFPQGFAFY